MSLQAEKNKFAQFYIKENFLLMCMVNWTIKKKKKRAP